MVKHQGDDERVLSEVRRLFDQAFCGVVASASWTPGGPTASPGQVDSLTRSPDGTIEQIAYSERTASWMALVAEMIAARVRVEPTAVRAGSEQWRRVSRPSDASGAAAGSMSIRCPQTY